MQQKFTLYNTQQNSEIHTQQKTPKKYFASKDNFNQKSTKLWIQNLIQNISTSNNFAWISYWFFSMWIKLKTYSRHFYSFVAKLPSYSNVSKSHTTIFMFCPTKKCANNIVNWNKIVFTLEPLTFRQQIDLRIILLSSLGWM